jgi:hypothetical protein
MLWLPRPARKSYTDSWMCYQKASYMQAKRFLEYLRSMSNPVVRAMIEAPEDDETTTPEEDQGAKEAWQEHLRGDSVSAEEAKRELLS